MQPRAEHLKPKAKLKRATQMQKRIEQKQKKEQKNLILSHWIHQMIRLHLLHQAKTEGIRKRETRTLSWLTLSKQRWNRSDSCIDPEKMSGTVQQTSEQQSNSNKPQKNSDWLLHNLLLLWLRLQWATSSGAERSIIARQSTTTTQK